MVATDNPHNQYLLTGVELGVVGLFGLLGLFIVQWRMAARLPPGQERMLAFALLLSITTGCLFNSFLADHSEGLFYVWATALLCAGVPSPRTVEI
jgi:O-antigen ligase